MPAQLVSLSEGPNILLDKPILLLGRHPECDIQLNSKKISRRHCCLAQVNTYLVVRDLGSTNGIRINGVRVLEGRLKDGDELTVGNFRYQVNWEGTGSAQPLKTKARPQAPAAGVARVVEPTDDDLLESCDEPIPITDKGPPRPPRTPMQQPAQPPTVAKPDSFIIPDDVSLLPGDSNLNLPPPTTR